MRKKTANRNLIFIVCLALFLAAFFVFSKSPVFASSTDGTIDSTYKYAWGENIGWVNFGISNGNVHVTDSGLSGYALSETVGWIYLEDIANDGEGNLSGYAWGENIGWIKFNPTNGGVIINSSGEFTGSALGENIGWIIFGGDYKVKTDWRPQSERPATASAPSSSGSSKSQFIRTPLPTLLPALVTAISPTIDRVINIFRPTPAPETLPEVPIGELVSKKAPLAFQGKWRLLPSEPIRKFVLAPLPKAIRNLAQKFPELGKTLEKVGISKITDVAKFKTVKLTLSNKSAVPQGVPVAKLSPAMKQQLPTEIVFAKTGGELIDFDIALSISDKGEPQQKIQTISGKPLQLVVKPDKPVKSVKGYVVFKSKASQQTSLELPSDSLLASIIFASPVFAKSQEQPVRIEEKLILLEFEYTDSDGDGIYTAEIQAPLIGGEYEIITVLDFDDPELGKKEIRLITVIDPEGYIYERNGDKETRIPGAVISLYWLNPEIKQYEMWPAKEYQQENPQITDVRGVYSFLVPEGYYYLKAETPGYIVYDGKPFQVKEGSGIHINIELKTKYWWLNVADWKTVLLVVVIILLLYNFYRDKIREKLMRGKIK